MKSRKMTSPGPKNVPWSLYQIKIGLLESRLATHRQVLKAHQELIENLLRREVVAQKRFASHVHRQDESSIVTGAPILREEDKG